jgi:protein TonB
MEPKKTKKANLEKKKGLFLEIGFVVTLGIVLLAFEWGTKTKEVKGFQQQEKADVAQESVPVTRQKQKKQPPPPPPPQAPEQLNIVENDVEIDDELDIQTTEADQDTEVDYDAFGQEEEEEEEQQIFVVVENMPSFRGKGVSAFRNYVQKNLEYPTVAQENGIQGTVFVKFVIDTDGGISNVTVLRSPDPSLSEEAKRVIGNTPKGYWEPGTQRGKPVRVQYTIPIVFKLQ